MGENKEKTIITDLSEIRKKEENQPYLKFAELILKQIKLGKTRDEIIQMILRDYGGFESDPREMKYFTDMVDLVYAWYNKNEGKESQVPDGELLTEMSENQKYLYKGEDGQYYATRAALDAANDNYWNQIHKKNPTRNM